MIYSRCFFVRHPSLSGTKTTTCTRVPFCSRLGATRVHSAIRPTWRNRSFMSHREPCPIVFRRPAEGADVALRGTIYVLQDGTNRIVSCTVPILSVSLFLTFSLTLFPSLILSLFLSIRPLLSFQRAENSGGSSGGRSVSRQLPLAKYPATEGKFLFTGK